MKFLLTVASLFVFFAVANGQIEMNAMKKLERNKKVAIDSFGWKKIGVVSVSINQSALQDWPAGGESFFLGINTMIDYAIHRRKGKFGLDAYVDIELGFVETTSFNQFRKTNDRVDLTLELERSLSKQWDVGILSNFISQFLPGKNYTLFGAPRTSSFLAPGKIILSPGFDFKVINEQSYFSVFMSPVTLRYIIKGDKTLLKQSRFGVDSARRVYAEVGPYLSFHLNHKFAPNISYIGRLDFFTNYKRKPENVDFLFNNYIAFKFTKKVAASLLLDIIYDDDIQPRPQIFQNFGLGLNLSF